MRSFEAIGFVGCPQPGQKPALSGMAAPQCEQLTSAGGESGGLNEAPPIVFLAALLTEAINLECMAGGYKMMLAADLLLEITNLRREKFHRSAASRADHVMVTAPVVLMLEARNTVVKSNLTREATIRKQLQRAVHGGETNVRIFLLHQLIELVGRKMSAGFDERPQNRAALLGVFQTNTTQMPEENLFGIAHALLRDSWLIVDSFLQHDEGGTFIPSFRLA
jgi:hypothetical protein